MFPDYLHQYNKLDVYSLFYMNHEQISTYMLLPQLGMLKEIPQL